MKKRTKKLVIFDLDGTLIDSMGDFADLAAKVMARHFYIDEQAARKHYVETSGLPFCEQLEKIFPEHPLNAKAVQEFEHEKKKDYLAKQAFADAEETIGDLRKKNLKVAISSNNFQELVDQFLGNTSLKFDLVLGFRQNFSKGEPHFTRISEELGISRDEMTFIGDSLHDAEKAYAAGIDFIGKAGTFSSADFQKHYPGARVVSALSELKEFF